MSRIEDIRARLEAATPGPWPEDYVYSAVRHIARNCDYIESYTDPDFGWDRYNDAPLVAHAPTDLRDLLAVAEAAKLLDSGLALRCRIPRRIPLRNGIVRNEDCRECVPCALRAALARLDGEPTDG